MSEVPKYKRIKLLGEGSYGKAYLVECLQDSSKCVIKQINLFQLSEEEKRHTIDEARILESLNHPNIIRFREMYKTKSGKLCIVMDYADGGDLFQKIKTLKPGEFFTESQILDWLIQLSQAILHVHERKIIHRDLKSQNVFLTNENMIKLGDFGIARILKSTNEKARTIVGTPYYLSPELIEGREYTAKTDVWSLGVILYEMCCLKPPFNAENIHALGLKITKGNYNAIPNRYSNEMKKLVSWLMQIDPNKRPNISDIFNYPLIRSKIKGIPLYLQIQKEESKEQNIIEKKEPNLIIRKIKSEEIKKNVDVLFKNNNKKPSQEKKIKIEKREDTPLLTPFYDKKEKIKKNGVILKKTKKKKNSKKIELSKIEKIKPEKISLENRLKEDEEIKQLKKEKKIEKEKIREEQRQFMIQDIKNKRKKPDLMNIITENAQENDESILKQENTILNNNKYEEEFIPIEIKEKELENLFELDYNYSKETQNNQSIIQEEINPQKEPIIDLHIKKMITELEDIIKNVNEIVEKKDFVKIDSEKSLENFWSSHFLNFIPEEITEI